MISNIQIYSWQPLQFEAIPGETERDNRIQIRNADEPGEAVLWLNQEQAAALRRALDRLYPPRVCGEPVWPTHPERDAAPTVRENV